MRSITFLVTLIAAFLFGPHLARADWREDMGRLRIGIAEAELREDAVSRFEPFRLAIEERLGLPVEILPFSSLVSLARAHAGGRLEYAVYPATSYAAVWINCECVEPLAVAAHGDGTTASHSVLIARKNSGIRVPSGLAGRRVWLLEEDAILSHRYALQNLKEAYPGFREEAVEWLTGDSPGDVITRFVQGEGDALIGWSSMVGDMSEGYSRGTPKLIAAQADGFSGYVIAWQSPPLAHHVHAIRKNIDGEAKRLLRNVLAEMHTVDPVAYDSIEPILEGGLQTVPHSSFSTAIDFVKSLLPEKEAEREIEEGGDQPAPSGTTPDNSDQ